MMIAVFKRNGRTQCLSKILYSPPQDSTGFGDSPHGALLQNPSSNKEFKSTLD